MKCSCKDVCKCDSKKMKAADKLEKEMGVAPIAAAGSSGSGSGPKIKKPTQSTPAHPGTGKIKMDKPKFLDHTAPKPGASAYDIKKSYKLLRNEEYLSKENPDKEQEAELGEKIEELVEQHMKENKEAEEKEGHEITFKSELKPGMSFKDLKKQEEVAKADIIAGPGNRAKMGTVFATHAQINPEKTPESTDKPKAKPSWIDHGRDDGFDEPAPKAKTPKSSKKPKKASTTDSAKMKKSLGEKLQSLKKAVDKLKGDKKS